MAMAPERIGIGIRRHFTTAGLHPYDEVAWERRDARITNFRDGSVAFEQPDVEVPTFWSQNATNILAQKYFRGQLGSPQRETSLKQVADRVADTIAGWGEKDGYFVDAAEAAAFRDELKYLIVHQRAAFNSPVWFNIGVKGAKQQASACQPWHAPVSTPEGLVPIGKLVDGNAVGTKVYDAYGVAVILAVQANGTKPVIRVQTTAGPLEVTPDHLVWRSSGGDSGVWAPAGELRPGDRLEWHCTEPFSNERAHGTGVAEVTIERIDDLGPQPVYDIQTESGEYLSGNIRVHNYFILAVEDTMDGILDWYKEEGTIFKGGSGSGINLSRIRSSKEPLKGGGTASGPVSFMRGADASAGTIKSGGTTRRAAKMVILNADHPDIEDFIWCKAIEERKARALRDAGFDMDLDGKDSHSIQYQNANNSVRVTDDFMQAVIDDGDWYLRAVTTGQVLETMKARDLFRQIAKAAWECADPGLQFDTTINRWHTAANTGRINASNPCCFVGETEVLTADGPVRIAELVERCDSGDQLPRVRSFDAESAQHVTAAVNKVWVAGYTRSLVEVALTCGRALRCTPEHRFLTATGAWVQARDLEKGQRVRTTDGTRRVRSVEEVELAEELAVYDLEAVGHHNFAVSLDDGAGVIVHNSEYVHLDNSACNLASINLLRFLREDDTFDVEGYKAAVEVVFTAQEILVGNADYPTSKIDATTRRFRQLGLGYANLGALLMAVGLPYDSDAGRAYAAALTALLTGHAYATSARTAMRMGPFAGYTENREHMNRVLRMHRAAVAEVDEELVPTDLLSAAQESWDTAVELGEVHGVRNSQATVLAPTGCLVGGSLVATSRGLVRLRSLGDLDGATWQDLDGLKVQTDIGPAQATKFYVNGLEPVVHVSTARGHAIRGTTKHQVKVVDPATGEWAWRRFADLRPGDLVPLSMDQLVGASQEVRLPPLPDAHWTSDHRTFAPRTMTPELAELIGYFMGDGSRHSRGLRFCVTAGDFDVVERLALLGKECFGLEAHVTDKAGHTEVRFDSVRLVLWWEACGFAKRLPRDLHAGKGYAPQIPDAVLSSNSRRVYAAFLRGLFEADGTVTSGCPHWMTTSLGFAEDVQALLLAMGYPTTKAIERRRTGRGDLPLAKLRLLNLALNDRWTDEVGFISSRKHGRVVREGTLEHWARKDYVPLTRELVDRQCPENGRLRRALLMALKRGTVSRTVATELFEETGDPELGHLLRFSYDRVESVELGEEELTYDLSVPATVTYLANGFVSHNTISFMMDCDTTGIEPDLGLVKTKKLVGGGTMSIVNQTVPRALRRLGYGPDEISEIVSYINEHYSVIGAPHLRSEHLPVFACSMGDLTIDYHGHVKMMAAVQSFISGAISKTVNMSESVTVEDVEQLHMDAWKLGLKAVAIYRDNCKVAQPLSATKTGDEGHTGPEAHDEELAAKVAQLEAALQRQTVVVKQPMRERLPRRRKSSTFAFRVADCEGYVTVGEYGDGRPGEVFMKVSKQGSTLAGIMDAFSISVSLGLQHGVPLATYVRKYTNMRFEPAGMTDDPDLRIASSLVDYIFRRLAVDYLPYDERAELGILTTGERMQPTLPGIEEETTPSAGIVEAPALPEPVRDKVVDVTLPAGADAKDAPYCYQCGNAMQRAGSCYVCTSCGTTSGCS
jgi:ribonucleoside-diphosphate reductase alpha chain